MPRVACLRCARPIDHCLCALAPSLLSRSRIVILQHPDEAGHALNTARLAALGLRNARLLVGETFAAQDYLLPGYSPYVLFPGPQALDARALAARHELAPRLLLVLDGTWRKARSLLHCNPELAALPRLALSDVPASRYRIRHAREVGALSTIEAVVHALNMLDAPDNFDALLKPFDALIEGQIAAMGPAVFERHYGARQKDPQRGSGSNH